MSYQVLARKWRPSSFKELVGQNHVVKALTYALDHNKIHHAYLFSGTRGVGKTSIARIFAKSLNCLNSSGSSSCGKCSVCIEVDSGNFVDLIEIDAASRTGVDETRSLIDSVSYLPVKGRYKVYLIDEVHMFSKSSFNALLKTLEEPPEYVKFILATTDPEKLPVTILSRCLQFNLKRLSENQLESHLRKICLKEEIIYDDYALERIAKAGDGSMRDSLSLMDQALAFGAGELKTESVINILGTVHPSDVKSIFLAIIKQDANMLYSVLNKLEDYDLDVDSLIQELLEMLQKLAWLKLNCISDEDYIIDFSCFSEVLDPAVIQLWYDLLINGKKEVLISSNKLAALEMLLLRIFAFTPSEQVLFLKKASNDIDTKEVDTKEVDTKEVDTKEVDTKEVDTKEVDTKEVDTKEVDAKEVDTKEVDTKEVDTKEVDTKEVDTKEVDTKEVDTKEVDTKEVDTKEVDTKEVDTKEVDTDSDFDWLAFLPSLSLSGLTQAFAESGELILNIDEKIANFIVPEKHMVLSSDKTNSELEASIRKNIGSDWRLIVKVGKISIDPSSHFSKIEEDHKNEKLQRFLNNSTVKKIEENLLGEVIKSTIKNIGE